MDVLQRQHCLREPAKDLGRNSHAKHRWFTTWLLTSSLWFRDVLTPPRNTQYSSYHEQVGIMNVSLPHYTLWRVLIKNMWSQDVPPRIINLLWQVSTSQHFQAKIFTWNGSRKVLRMATLAVHVLAFAIVHDETKPSVFPNSKSRRVAQ